MTSFPDLPLGGNLLRVLQEIGYEQPTPIQAQAIPHLLDGNDLLGVAQTGTGKTAAFALPVLHRLEEDGPTQAKKKPQALILAPTRELTVQIHDEFAALGKYTGLRQGIVIGGVSERPQIKMLTRGLDIVVATPGRLLDLANQGHIDLSEVSVLVLDEADRLLDMGFVRDVRRIVGMTPRTRQSLLFSATMPREVLKLAEEILSNPVSVNVSPKRVTASEIEQRVVHVANPSKQFVLEKLLRDDSVRRAIVFTRTKHAASRVAKKLERAGIGADAIHGNKSQNARQRALENFRSGDAWVLVATDIAARGIDVDNVTHVINFELPHEPESYVHRIGRTGRAGQSGIAWSLVDPTERKRLKAIERLIRHTPEEVEFDVPTPKPSDNVEERSRGNQRRPSGSQGNSRNRQGGNGQGGNSRGKQGQRQRSQGQSSGQSSSQSDGQSSNQYPPDDIGNRADRADANVNGQKQQRRRPSRRRSNAA